MGSEMFHGNEKHHMLAPSELDDKPIWHKPWYKERLEQKYMKLPGPDGKQPCRVTMNKWRFIRDGLDDFRDGLPPKVDNIFIQMDDNNTSLPNIKRDPEHYKNALKNLKQGTWKGRYKKEDVCYSRLAPQVRARRENVQRIEDGLLEHPLAIYPHFLESLPAELMDDVLTILDPDIAADDSRPTSTAMSTARRSVRSGKTDASGYTQLSETPRSSTPVETTLTQIAPNESALLTGDSGRDSVPGSEVLSEPARDHEYTGWSSDTSTPLPPPERKTSSTIRKEMMGQLAPSWRLKRNPYKWVNGEKNSEVDELLAQPDEDAHIKQVTQEFCKWVAGLGGETNNIEPSTVHSLFASGYETKPSLLVPIHVVELQNVPAELRAAAGKSVVVNSQTINTISDVEALKREQRQDRSKANAEFGRFTYGAWYLPRKLWQKRDQAEPLIDPEELKKLETSETVKMSSALDDDLAPTHATKSFLRFLNKKPAHVRKPVFMKRVAHLQERLLQDQGDGNPS